MVSEKQPRVLVISVGSWSSKVGSTWPSLLKCYDSENVANICIRDEYPDSDVASRYFSISENRVLKSIFNRNIKTGREIELQECPEKNQDLAAHNERYSKMRKNRRYSLLLARELAWKLGKWKSAELDSFIDSFNPDVILYSMTVYIHHTRLVEYAIKRTGAKAVAYIWDDTFTYKQSNKIGYKIYRFFQRKSLKRVAKLTNKFFAISDLTKKEADEFFGIDSIILTKPLYRVPEVDYSNFEMPIKAVYAGNLFIGRDKSLARIIKAAERINNDGIKIKFDIYTSTELSDTIKEQLTCDCCEIHAAVPQEEVFEIQRHSDLMLFVEDIDGPDARIARLSFSTKITDYLSSGKCIFAVGYKETAPMQYFINNDVAVIATDDKEIEEKLSMLVNNPDLLVKYAENARDVGIRNHNEEKIISTFDNCIKSVI
ncbi:MAG: hypothetical protein J6B37_09200 [Clostridia bacterium]|nr:hypothetical protein [Clostridia bacterium]